MTSLSVRLLCVSALAAAMANAASSYQLTIYRPTTVGSTQLAAGQYKVEMLGDKAVFIQGKKSVEVPATLEKSEQKFQKTSYTEVGSKIKEVDLGGTNDRIILTAPSGLASGSK
jgi:hypothetical protein